MSTAAAPLKVWTTDDLLAMPDDGVERWMIRGQLREKPQEFKTRDHAAVLATIGTALVEWLRSRPKPRGAVYSGNVGMELPGGSVLGADIVYASAALVAEQDDLRSELLVGAPTHVIEILSPSDTQEEIEEKIDEYLAAGVPIVWTVNTHRRTVTVHRPEGEPRLFTRLDRLPEHPAMPSFAPTVAELFE
jgi:Uma2 family endonuclease